MIGEMNQVKRYLGARFGYGEPIKDGIYAIPTDTSKGEAFMKMEIANGSPSGEKNFHLFWDEDLTISWYDNPKPEGLTESEYSKSFRVLDNIEL
jgi:hypothetical protein